MATPGRLGKYASPCRHENLSCFGVKFWFRRRFHRCWKNMSEVELDKVSYDVFVQGISSRCKFPCFKTWSRAYKKTILEMIRKFWVILDLFCWRWLFYTDSIPWDSSPFFTNHLGLKIIGIFSKHRRVANPSYSESRWQFQIFFISPLIWGRFPIWLIFFRWAETTNQELFYPGSQM